MVAPIWCNKCGSDTEGAHYGSCPDHPTKQALQQRASGRPSVQEAVRQATNPTRASTPGKADWFSADTDMTFSPDQLKKVFEHFLLNVLDLDVEVTDITASSIRGAKITFKAKQSEPEVEDINDELSEAELKAMQEAQDEMVRARETDKGN